METTFNVEGPKEKVNALIEQVKQMTGENPVSDAFPADGGCRSVNITVSLNKAVDHIVEYCEDNNITCEFI